MWHEWRFAGRTQKHGLVRPLDRSRARRNVRVSRIVRFVFGCLHSVADILFCDVRINTTVWNARAVGRILLLLLLLFIADVFWPPVGDKARRRVRVIETDRNDFKRGRIRIIGRTTAYRYGPCPLCPRRARRKWISNVLTVVKTSNAITSAGRLFSMPGKKCLFKNFGRHTARTTYCGAHAGIMLQYRRVVLVLRVINQTLPNARVCVRAWREERVDSFSRQSIRKP